MGELRACINRFCITFQCEQLLKLITSIVLFSQHQFFVCRKVRRGISFVSKVASFVCQRPPPELLCRSLEKVVLFLSLLLFPSIHYQQVLTLRRTEITSEHTSQFLQDQHVGLRQARRAARRRARAGERDDGKRGGALGASRGG